MNILKLAICPLAKYPTLRLSMRLGKKSIYVSLPLQTIEMICLLVILQHCFIGIQNLLSFYMNMLSMVRISCLSLSHSLLRYGMDSFTYILKS